MQASIRRGRGILVCDGLVNVNTVCWFCFEGLKLFLICFVTVSGYAPLSLCCFPAIRFTLVNIY